MTLRQLLSDPQTYIARNGKTLKMEVRVTPLGDDLQFVVCGGILGREVLYQGTSEYEAMQAFSPEHEAMFHTLVT